MNKTRKVTLRMDESTYQALTHAAKALGMNLSEYIRLLSLRSAEVVHAGMMDYVAQEVLKQVQAEVERLRRYWQEHPEKLLQVPERPPEGGP